MEPNENKIPFENLPSKPESRNLRNISQEFKDKISKKEFEFIKNISHGMKIVDAYYKAGFRGKSQAQPYSLHSRLKQKISSFISQDFFNRDKVAIELNRLLELPLNPSTTFVTFSEKLRAIRLLGHVLPDNRKPEANFSRFQIYVNSGSPVTVGIVNQGETIGQGSIDVSDGETYEG